MLQVTGIPANVKMFIAREAVAIRIEKWQAILDNIATLQIKSLDRPLTMIDFPANMFKGGAENRYVFCPSTWGKREGDGKPVAQPVHQAVLPGAPPPYYRPYKQGPSGSTREYSDFEGRFLVPCNDRHDQIQLTQEGADLMQFWRTVLQQEPIRVDGYVRRMTAGATDSVADAPFREGDKVFLPSLIFSRRTYRCPELPVPSTAQEVWGAPTPFGEKAREFARWAWATIAPSVRREDFPSEAAGQLGYPTTDKLIGQPLHANKVLKDGASILAYLFYQYSIMHARRTRSLRELDMQRIHVLGRDKQLLEEAHEALNELGALPLHPAFAAFAAYQGGTVDTYAGQYPAYSLDPAQLSTRADDKEVGAVVLPWSVDSVLSTLEIHESESSVTDPTKGSLGFRWWREIVKLPAMAMAASFFTRMGFKTPYAITVTTDQAAACVAVSDGASVSEDPIAVALGLIPSVPDTQAELRSLDKRYYSDLATAPNAVKGVVAGRPTWWTSIMPMFLEPQVTEPIADVEYSAIPAYADMGTEGPISSAYLELGDGPKIADGATGVSTPARMRDESGRVNRFYATRLPGDIPSTCRPRFIQGAVTGPTNPVVFPAYLEPYVVAPSSTSDATLVESYTTGVGALLGDHGKAAVRRETHSFIIAAQPTFLPRYPVQSATSGNVLLMAPDTGILLHAFEQDGQAVVTLGGGGGQSYVPVLSLVAGVKRG